ncbi:hypothetical protein C1645_754581 [Glomus cerebriforme]|uniref:Uncharacterized protein n=1 Tax=Glomus cerebriforme TaxID=658196 RepID=A0A397TI01_9GLOM|nr:hypothetical protein C1645_754581 [Glomus cerebriforme]
MILHYPFCFSSWHFIFHYPILFYIIFFIPTLSFIIPLLPFHFSSLLSFFIILFISFPS